MKAHTCYERLVFLGGMLLVVSLLNACASPQQEQSLTQIQSQISVLSNEVRDAFNKSEEDSITLYENLNNEVRLLQKNQADASVINDQLAASLIAIESKLDEYNARMMKLSERLNSTETALTDRITSLSEQMSEIGSETTITSGPPVEQSSTPTSDSTTGDSAQPAEPGAEMLDPEASQMYHNSYTRYVNGDFESAIAGFQKYLEQYPETDLTDIAQFWIAESFFSLGEYHALLRELAQAKKDIYRSTDRLERYSRKIIKTQRPKIRQLCRESRKRLNKIIEIDKALYSFEKKQFSENVYFGNSTERDKQATEKRQASHKRYQQNIKKIEGSKQQYLQEVQEVIRFLHELNSQILALKYSHEKRRIQTQIAETIDELLIDIQTLEEMT